MKKHFPNVDLSRYATATPTLLTDYQDVYKYAIDHRRTPRYIPELRSLAMEVCKAALTFPLLKRAKIVVDGVPKFPPITFDEACETVTKDTSPGFPFTEQFSTKGAVLEAYHFDGYPLHQKVQDLLDGTEPLCIYSVKGKFEVRDAAKIEMDKLRTFTVAPMHVNLIGTMATYNLQAAINSCALECPIANGLDIHHGNWNIWLSRFEQPHLLSFAYSSDRPTYDASVGLEDHEVSTELENHFLTPEAQRLNNVAAFHDSHHFVLMADGEIGYLEGTEPSGCSKTILVNSFVNIFKFYYFVAYLRWRASQRPVAEFARDERVQDYLRNLALSVCGDDSVHTSTPSWDKFCRPSHLNQAISECKQTCFYDNYDDDRDSPENAIFMSMNTARVRGARLPRLVSVEKLLASLVLGEPRDLKMSRPVFTLQRLWQYCTAAYPDQFVYQRLMILGAELENEYERDYGLPAVLQGRSSQLSSQELHALWALPRIQQSRPDVAGEDESPPIKMSSKKTNLGKARQANPTPAVAAARAAKRAAQTAARVAKKLASRKRRQGGSRRRGPPPSSSAPVAQDNTVGLKRKHYTRIVSHRDSSLVIEGFEPFMPVETPATHDVAVSILSYQFSPNENNLPRLSAFSSLFERYKVRSASFHYVPVMPTSANGTTYIAAQYDVLEDAPSTTSEFLEAETHTYGPIWRPANVSIDPKCIRKEWYYTSTTSADPAGSANQRLDSAFAITLGISGLTNTELSREVGVIFCRYVVEFDGVRLPKPVAVSMPLLGTSMSIGLPANSFVDFPLSPPANNPLQFPPVFHTSAQFNTTDDGWNLTADPYLVEIPKGVDFRAYLAGAVFSVTHTVAQGVNHSYDLAIAAYDKDGNILASKVLAAVVNSGTTGVNVTDVSLSTAFTSTAVTYVGFRATAATTLATGTRSAILTGRMSVVRVTEPALTRSIGDDPLLAFSLPDQLPECQSAIASFDGTVVLLPPSVPDIEDGGLKPDELVRLRELLSDPDSARACPLPRRAVEPDSPRSYVSVGNPTKRARV